MLLKIYFEKYVIVYLVNMFNILCVFIVMDFGMVEYGYVDIVVYYLNKYVNDVKVEVFFEVELDLLDEIVFKGVEMMRSFKLDVIIVFGGGLVMDVVKGMWLFYEYLEMIFYGIK